MSIAIVENDFPPDFVAEYCSKNRPLLIKHGARYWKSVQEWTVPGLARKFGDVAVDLEFASNCLFDPNENTGRPKVNCQSVPFSEAALKIMNGPEDGAYYVRETPLTGALRNLNLDLGKLPRRPRFVKHIVPRIWVGSKGAASPLHFDGGDNNILVHMAGRKEFDLYPPEDTENLYPNSEGRLPHLSLADPLNPDYERFPKLKRAHKTRLVLEPGDVLYVPAYWWHSTRSLSTSISVNFWWQETWLSRLVPSH